MLCEDSFSFLKHCISNRSFNLGSGGSLSLSQGNRRSSEANKSLTAKIKKSFFPRSRAHSHSSSGKRKILFLSFKKAVLLRLSILKIGIDEGDDQGDSFCKNPSSVSPLKTVLEVEKQAPIATPDSSEDSSTQVLLIEQLIKQTFQLQFSS